MQDYIMMCSNRYHSNLALRQQALYFQKGLTSLVDQVSTVLSMYVLSLLQAMTLYEECVSDQRARVTALHTIIGTLYACHVFGAENRDTLTQVRSLQGC
jgi:hypothetical protein